MKKIFTLVLILGIGKLFSQSVIYTEDFSASTFTRTADWTVNNNGTYPTCSVAGSSGSAKLIAVNGTSTFQQAGTPAINTTTFVNIQVSWNMIRGTSSSPAVTFQWSNDAGTTWNTASYTAPGTAGVWAAVPTVTLPAGANLTTVYLRWTYTGTSVFTDYVGIDDIKITGTPTPSYYYKGSGALDNVSNWGTNTDGSGANPIDFVTNNQNFYLENTAAVSLTAPWTISGSNTFMNIGDGTVGNKCNLTIPSGFALTVSGNAKLNVNNSSTLTIQNTTFPSEANVSLTSNSTVDFAQSSTVTLWDMTYGNLTLSGSGDRNQSNSNFGLTVVAGEFKIGASNNYVMVNSPGVITELQGKITCNGNITTALSNLTIDGSSANTIGTLNFNGTNTINDLALSRSGQTLTLGSNLTTSGILGAITLFTNGSVNLNGKALTLNGAVTFPASSANGDFVGTTTSTLIIGGSGTLTNGLIMNQGTVAAKTLGTFSLSRASSTLVLGSDLISTTSIFTNGSLSLSGKSYSINGVTTFPASSANGVFIGSTTSSLTIGGASNALNNTLLMSQTNTASKSLGLFAMNRPTSTISLGNNLIVSGTTQFVNGTVDLNGTLLTLSGPLSLPTSTVNRGIQGSLTSSLTIDGASSITSGSLVMIQTSASTRALSQLTMNRNGETLIIAKPLETYGEVLPLDGTIASNGNLFIRSNATNKGRIGPMGATAAISGNAIVETFALGGNTDWTNLGSSGINNLTVASWEGQIPMTCLSCPNDQYSAGSYFVSIQSWDPTAAASSTAAYVPMHYADALNVGQGYWVFLGNGLPTTSNITWTVAGTVVQGPQTITLTTVGSGTADGYNLISNPYASPISWDDILADPANSGTAVDNAIYVYSPDLGYSTSYAGGISSDYPGGITDTIPMGQGFYVQAQAATTLTILESHKIKSNTPLLKTTNTNIGSVVRLNVEGGGYKDATAIRFHSDATTGYDKKLDARKIFDSPGYVGTSGIYSLRTTISTRSGNEDYSINSLPYVNSQDAVIPVLVRVYATGQHTITGTQLENLPNSCVILKDKLDNSTHDLKSGAYVFNISDTTFSPRFELRVCADPAMSIKNQTATIAQQIFINNDANGASVKFDFDQPTKSVISVTNILGQKIMDDKSVTVEKDKVNLDIPEKNQLIFVTVTTENNKITKKIVR